MLALESDAEDAMLFLKPLLMLVCFITCMSAHTAQPIRFGMSAPLSTKAGALGKDYRDGANLVFQQANLNNGIAGRPIELVCLDDGYEPLRTVDNTRQLLADPKMFALFGYIGTPTVNAALPLLRKNAIPFIAPFTGAELIRQPQDTFVFNFRASYREEIDRQFAVLIDHPQFQKIGLLVQADEFGASVEQLIMEQLRRRNLTPTVVARYQRNSNDINIAIQHLANAKPDIVLTVGHYQAIAAAITTGQKLNFNPSYSVVSFTGVSQLRALLKAPFTVYASMVMPLPEYSSTHPLVQEYIAASRKTGTHQPSDVGLEGFASAKLVVAALHACEQAMSRECFIKALPNQQLTGFDLRYQPTKHQASNQVFLMKITANSMEQL